MIDLTAFPISLCLVVLAVLLHKPWQKRPLSMPYPPGPSPKPIIGNAFDMPFKKAWLQYLQWSKQFQSDIIHLSAMNTHIVVVHTIEDIMELMERRSANYSCRPSNPLIKLLNFDATTGLLPYGKTLRTHRRIMDDGLKKDVIPSYHNVFSDRVHLLLEQMLHKPADAIEHCRNLGASVTMAIAFGYDVAPGRTDHFVDAAEFAVRTAADLALPGRTLLAIFGFLGCIPPWVPGASTQKLCAKVREATIKARNWPFCHVKQNMTTGRSKDCVLTRIFELVSKDKGAYKDEEILKDAMVSFYFGGVETMQIAQANFILAMALYPHEQKLAQEEIYRVIGCDRLPSYNDRASLPYVEALYREVLRWRPVFPVSIPHVTIRDDIYKGYYIPKGTIVVPNVWAVTRNEDKYPEPELFKPERFLKADRTLNDDTASYAFGFGRRICPGRYMADNVVWLMIASVLATFDISKAKDENGVEIPIDPDAYTDGLTSHPLPFNCSITPRSLQAESMIHCAAGAAWLNFKTTQ